MSLSIKILVQHLEVAMALLQDLQVAEEAFDETGQLDLFQMELDNFHIYELTKTLYQKARDANFVEGFVYLLRIMQFP